MVADAPAPETATPTWPKPMAIDAAALMALIVAFCSARTVMSPTTWGSPEGPTGCILSAVTPSMSRMLASTEVLISLIATAPPIETATPIWPNAAAAAAAPATLLITESSLA